MTLPSQCTLGVEVIITSRILTVTHMTEFGLSRWKGSRQLKRWTYSSVAASSTILRRLFTKRQLDRGRARLPCAGYDTRRSVRCGESSHPLQHCPVPARVSHERQHLHVVCDVSTLFARETKTVQTRPKATTSQPISTPTQTPRPPPTNQPPRPSPRPPPRPLPSYHHQYQGIHRGRSMEE